ncbi:YciI family protein [Nocardioides insulae]|uniref:YciI family protein n=1 Tax=Nocardioides insulae TaxID=394734 RepID=UPI0003FF4D4E|nr:YciI family protein [Nocardioides insulae]
MKFMTMVHETNRPSDQPPAELFAAIGALQAEESASGALVEAGGLMPIESGAVVRLAGGAVTTTDGPFVETKELVGGYAVYDLPDLGAAVAKTEEFLAAHRNTWPGWEGWVEIRPMFGGAPD